MSRPLLNPTRWRFGPIIAQDSIEAANRLLDRFDRLFRLISTQPRLGKAVEELAPRLRFVPLGSYLVFYQPVDNGVQIVRLLHGARDITAEFFRE